MAKAQVLNIFLSKKGVTSDDCINSEKIKEFGAQKISLKSTFNGALYVYSSPSAMPDWISYLDSIQKNKGQIQSLVKKGNSNSALLLTRLKQANRWALFAFGYAKSLVRYGAMEIFFGRNVVLNTMASEKILSIKSRSYDRQPRHKDNQGTVSSRINEFDIDFQTEILQRLTGEYEERFFEGQGFQKDSIGRKLTGYDSLTLSTTLPPQNIEELCEWLADKFENEKYKDELPDIDSFTPVKNEDLISELNIRLLDRIKDDEFANFHISTPVFLDPGEYHFFSISGLGKAVKNDVKSELVTMQDFFDALESAGKLDELTVDDLRTRYKLVCLSSMGDERNKAHSLYRCLTATVEYSNATYSLIDGDWYEINQDFFDEAVKRLNKRFHSNFVSLSPYHGTDADEYAYNQRQSTQYGHHLFDQENITLRGRGRVEVCDLLSRKGDLIHVKRYTASASLSHLFAQAYVSIKSLMEDEKFKEKFLAKLPNQAFKTRVRSNLENRKSNIVLGILMRSSKHHRVERKIENLPAFSVVNLNKVVREIESLGFKVRIQIVFSE